MKTFLSIFLISIYAFVAVCFYLFTYKQFDNRYAKVYSVEMINVHVKHHITPLPMSVKQLTKEQVKELTCLTTNMYHEAKGESDIGWLAVAMVTMNRVQSKRYPNTVCKVVYQNNGRVYQFSWAGTKKKLTKPKKDLYNEIKELALLVYVHHKKLYDVTDNALWFHADYVDPYWNKSMNKTTKIGRHIFYKL